MRYEYVNNLPSHPFKRLVGVRHQTFRSMVWVMRMHPPPKLKSGRPSKLSLEDQVLVTLQYWRESRTYFHIGETWGVSEATICRVVYSVENTLIRSGRFRLPRPRNGSCEDMRYQPSSWLMSLKRQLRGPSTDKSSSLVAKRKDIPSNPSSWLINRAERLSARLMARGDDMTSGSGKRVGSGSIPAPKDWEIKAIKAGESCIPIAFSPQRSPKENRCPNKKSAPTGNSPSAEW